MMEKPTFAGVLWDGILTVVLFVGFLMMLPLVIDILNVMDKCRPRGPPDWWAARRRRMLIHYGR